MRSLSLTNAVATILEKYHLVQIVLYKAYEGILICVGCYNAEKQAIDVMLADMIGFGLKVMT